jgi:hypothetical protein
MAGSAVADGIRINFVLSARVADLSPSPESSCVGQHASTSQHLLAGRHAVDMNELGDALGMNEVAASNPRPFTLTGLNRCEVWSVPDLMPMSQEGVALSTN